MVRFCLEMVDDSYLCQELYVRKLTGEQKHFLYQHNEELAAENEMMTQVCSL